MEQNNHFNTEAWRKLIEEKIAPIKGYANAFLKFRKFLESFSEKYISEVLKTYPELKIVFLGGTKPPFWDEKREGYEEGSFALAIKKIFGASVSLSAYYSLEVQGFEPKTPVKVERTATLEFIEEIEEITSEILRIAREKGLIREGKKEIEEDEYVKKPNEVFNGLMNFLQLCLNATVGADPLVTFAWNIRKITRKYLQNAFPEAKEERNMRFLTDMLGLKEYFIPDVEVEDARSNYTIFAYPDYATEYVKIGVMFLPNGRSEAYMRRYENREVLKRYKELQTLSNPTIGGLLCRLNEVVWKFFSSSESTSPYFKGELLYVLKDVSNPEKEYLTKCESKLGDLDWEKRFNIRGVEYEVSGVLITKAYDELRIRAYDYNYPFLILLDEIMPSVFLGLHDIIFSKDKRRFVIIKRKEIKW